MKPSLLLFAALCAARFAAAQTGFDFKHQDWETVCSNLGTCYLSGYQTDGDRQNSPPVSVQFVRSAGKNAGITGRVALLSDYFGKPPQPASGAVGLKLDGKSLGSIRLTDGIGRLTDAQTQTLFTALKHQADIRFESGKTVWRLSDKGAAAAILQAEMFQGRLNTSKADFAKTSAQPTQPEKQAFQAKDNKKDNKQTRDAVRFIGSDDKRQAALLAMLRNRPVDGRRTNHVCLNLHDDFPHTIAVYPLGGGKVLAETACLRDQFQTAYLQAVMDEGLSRIDQILPLSLGGFGQEESFDVQTGTLTRIAYSSPFRDCRTLRQYRWDGASFMETAHSVTGMCRGFPDGAWMMHILAPTVSIEWE